MKLRQRWKVAWDDGDPVEVRTNALDASVANDHADPNLAAMAVVHHALDREGYPVPPFRKWVEVLDELKPISADGRLAIGVSEAGEFIYDTDDPAGIEDEHEEVAAQTRPTKRAASRGARSRSRS